MEPYVYCSEERYYGNCLSVALKHKFANPANVKLVVIPPWLNEVPVPHFMWIHGPYAYDFHRDNVPRWHVLWFRGYIRRRNAEWLDDYRARMRTYHRNRIRKIFHIRRGGDRS